MEDPSPCRGGRPTEKARLISPASNECRVSSLVCSGDTAPCRMTGSTLHVQSHSGYPTRGCIPRRVSREGRSHRRCLQAPFTSRDRTARAEDLYLLIADVTVRSHPGHPTRNCIPRGPAAKASLLPLWRSKRTRGQLSRSQGVQGYLVHKKTLHPRTLQ